MPVVGVAARKVAADSCEFFAPSCAVYSGNLLPSGSEEVAKNLWAKRKLAATSPALEMAALSAPGGAGPLCLQSNESKSTIALLRCIS